MSLLCGFSIPASRLGRTLPDAFSHTIHPTDDILGCNVSLFRSAYEVTVCLRSVHGYADALIESYGLQKIIIGLKRCKSKRIYLVMEVFHRSRCGFFCDVSMYRQGDQQQECQDNNEVYLTDWCGKKFPRLLKIRTSYCTTLLKIHLSSLRPCQNMGSYLEGSLLVMLLILQQKTTSSVPHGRPLRVIPQSPLFRSPFAPDYPWCIYKSVCENILTPQQIPCQKHNRPCAPPTTRFCTKTTSPAQEPRTTPGVKKLYTIPPTTRRPPFHGTSQQV